MSNDLTIKADWMIMNEIWIYQENEARYAGIEKIWKMHYSKRRVNKQKEHIPGNIFLSKVRFDRDVTHWLRDYDYFPHDLYQHVVKLINDIYLDYGDFAVKHMRVIRRHNIHTHTTFSVYFDNALISFILQKGLRYDIIRDYLIYRNTETAVNKVQKTQEVDDLYQICLGQLTKGEQDADNRHRETKASSDEGKQLRSEGKV
jgi:hypothetical protein